MAGFLISLKKRKVDRPPQRSDKGFEPRSDEESDLDGKVVEITLFDGSSISDSPKHKPPLVIEQRKLVKLIPKQSDAHPEPTSDPVLKHGLNTVKPKAKDTRATDPHPTLLPDEEARRSILAGESMESDTALVISAGAEDDGTVSSEENEDQYARVPVEQFGAAMLRGMGWKPLPKDKTKKVLLEKRQRGPLLGIGAVGVEQDVISELNGPRGAKLTIPTLRRNRATGEIIRNENLKPTSD